MEPITPKASMEYHQTLQTQEFRDIEFFGGSEYSGNDSVGAWAGYIGEVIVYSSALTSGQIQQIEGYLAKKWAFVTTTPAFSSPSSISGLQLWIDASDSSTVTTSGGKATNVADKSPNNLTLSGCEWVSLSQQYIQRLISILLWFKHCKLVDLGSNSIALPQPLTVFFVGMRPSISPNWYDGYMFDGLNSTDRIFQYGDYLPAAGCDRRGTDYEPRNILPNVASSHDIGT
jgi:hypothetical protein